MQAIMSLKTEVMPVSVALLVVVVVIVPTMLI